MIAAVILGPILAIQVEKLLEERRERKRRKLDLFRTLMSTRAAGLFPVHVDALNRIDIEFQHDTKVTEAWKGYSDHLNSKALTGDAWEDKRKDVLTDLLHVMAKSLGYHFDKVHIKRAAYYPQGYGDAEQDNLMIRKGFVKVISGESALPMNVTSFPVDETFAKQQAELWNLMIRSYKGEFPLAVRIVTPDEPKGRT